MIAAAAELVARLGRLDRRARRPSAPGLRRGQRLHRPDPLRRDLSTSIPKKRWLEGTRRWLPGTDPAAVERDFRVRLAQLAADTRTTIACDWMLDPRRLRARSGRPAGGRVSALLSSDLGVAAAHRAQAVRRRRQQLRGPGGRAGDHPRPARGRPAHGLGMGRDRRPGPRRVALRGNRRWITARLTANESKDPTT